MKRFKLLSALIILCLFLSILPSCTAKNVQANSNEPSKSLESSEEKANEADKQKDIPSENPKNVAYVSASSLIVRENPQSNAKAVDKLLKGSEVEIIESKTDDKNSLWYKIDYTNGSRKIEGWIFAKYTVKERKDLLSAELKNLDFSPQEKASEYPSNPRVKVKGIYVTLYSASNSRIDELIEMTKRTGINAFVIDVKDDNGTMLFPTKAAEKYAPLANKRAPIKDISSFMKKLKDNNIYAIARIVSFKDPTYTKAHPDRAIIYKGTNKVFTNKDNLAWATAYDKELWDYNISVAKEAAKAGFNEIQFDYVRFPASNGGKLDKILDYRNTENISKPLAIQNYLKLAYKELSPLNVYISADIYGLVGSVPDDMALGQYFEAVSNVVDYVCPMMYPSHYANGTYGLGIPDAKPYETVLNSAKDCMARNKNIKTPAIIRPWIQDFTATWVKGHIPYGVNEVKGEIKALEENGIDEFLLWNAGNKYTEDAVR
ncbi:hypothetical protein SAMN05443428_10451 [Caloramator quimbayensis]|uniref:SH3b domain-containing protein n=1 Tax=Caloramator quimbayensis TaxID=1147123 RepID=A0A1T4WVG5_9CLOT|nr:putative glycoside hydrolase [Caloramator quimbayensis]SKA81372.1 hypothetical protein SAMN05443428_10451 [Caloramator quimbayensis]